MTELDAACKDRTTWRLLAFGAATPLACIVFVLVGGTPASYALLVACLGWVVAVVAALRLFAVQAELIAVLQKQS